MVHFEDIEFGYKSAEAERRNKPELLLGGFFQKSHVMDDLLDGSEYLVLGYKGSGKSAIAEHLSLLSDSDPELFVETILLRDFPFEQVPKVVGGEIDVAVRTNLAWSILLLLKLFESLTRDEGASATGALDIGTVRRELERLNLLPKRKFRDLVLASRELNLGLELEKVFKASMTHTYQEPVLVLSHVRDILRDMVSGALTNSRHVLIIDGLDEVFTLFSETYQTIASLVHEVDSLNAEFHHAESAAKIVLLCRTDLFERLPSPNINKLRDYAITLDWYHNPTRPTDSDLFAVAQQRAKLAGHNGRNIVRDVFPEILRRRYGSHINTDRFLLDHTRHTPRDFLQVLFYIQEASDAGRVTDERIFDGLREYSIAYFLPEVKDELAGYFTPEQVESCFRIVGGLRKREFEMRELQEYADVSGYADGVDLREALRVLFDCSAVGNIVYRPRGRSAPGVYYTFKFRNRNASVNFAEKFVLHRGIWKSLNLT